MRNKRSIGVWILSGLLAAEFLLAGGMKLAGAEQIAKQFDAFGYSRTFMYLVGAAEVICAPLLLWPRLAFYAAVFLPTILCGGFQSRVDINRFAGSGSGRTAADGVAGVGAKAALEFRATGWGNGRGIASPVVQKEG